MFKDDRNIYAGTNEIYRYGKEAIEKVSKALTANDKGFYSIAADGGKFWTIGTSDGKFGEYAKINGICFSVNKGGYVWAKEGTDKAEAFKAAINGMLEKMNQMNQERIDALMSAED